MQYTTFIFQILLATLLGGLIGWERHRDRRAAGIRTFALVSLGSTLFTLIALNNFGPSGVYIMAQVLTGIGFICAGTIIHTKQGGVEGLTTAAGLWATAAIGMAVGIGWYWQTLIVTTIIFLILSLRGKNR